MRIILSRKGFDSSNGGVPSPIFPDSKILSLPIPDERSKIRYNDINWCGNNIGNIVERLTKERMSGNQGAHLDPDLNKVSYPRDSEWKPVFGQEGSALGHLDNNKINTGDLFLFFGSFNRIDSKFQYIGNTIHMIWGWLQVKERVKVDDIRASQRYSWMFYHPHFQREARKNNALFIAGDYIQLPNIKGDILPGAGIFTRYNEALQLTKDRCTRSIWRLPQFFCPDKNNPKLSYHFTPKRWSACRGGVELKSVNIGQEFVIDCNEHPGLDKWASDLIQSNWSYL